MARQNFIQKNFAAWGLNRVAAHQNDSLEHAISVRGMVLSAVFGK
jgi:hypothetical protein